MLKGSRPKHLIKVQFVTDILSVLNGQFSVTNLQIFSFIAESILGLSNSVTTLSVSRFSSLSYRTVQRFYALKDVKWHLVNLLLFKLVYQKDKQYIMAADETVKAKAGKSTYGIGLFYSSIAKRVIKSVSFLAISIIDIQSQTSYILGIQQLIGSSKSGAKRQPTKPKKDKIVRSKGRPKGSKNRLKAEPQSTSYQALKTLLALISSHLKVLLPDSQCFHLVLDGFYGHEDLRISVANHF